MSISSDRPTGRQDRQAQEAEMTERFQRIRLNSSEYGRMAQLVVPTGYFVEISYGRMAQLVEPTGQVIKLPVHEYLK